MSGVGKLDIAVQSIRNQQVADGKKKDALEKICRDSQSGEVEKQRVLNEKIAANQNIINALQGNITTNDDLVRDLRAKLHAVESKAQMWKTMQDRTAQIKQLTTQQRDGFHNELQSTSQVVQNFLDMLTKLSEEKAKKDNAAPNNNPKLRAPLASILEAIVLAKNNSIAHHKKTSGKSEAYQSMVNNKADTQLRNVQSIKQSIASLGQQIDQAKARIESIRSAIDVEKRFLWQSSNITTSFNEVCAAQLQGFTLRMAQRETVQKKAEEAIAWFTNRAEEIKKVVAKLNQAEQQAKEPAVKPPVAAQKPPSSPVAVLAVVQKELPASPDARFRQKRKNKGQKQLQPTHAHPRFRYVPAYTNQKDVHTIDKDQLEKELSDEFDSHLQSERDRLNHAGEKAVSAVRVGFKLSAGM